MFYHYGLSKNILQHVYNVYSIKKIDEDADSNMQWKNTI